MALKEAEENKEEGIRMEDELSEENRVRKNLL